MSSHGHHFHRSVALWNTDDSIAPFWRLHPHFSSLGTGSAPVPSLLAKAVLLGFRADPAKKTRGRLNIEGFDGLKVTRFWHHGETWVIDGDCSMMFHFRNLYQSVPFQTIYHLVI